MKKHDFYFELPNELIAQYPLTNRSDSRLLSYSKKEKAHQHRQFKDLPSLLEAGDLLVFNDSKVMPARLYGHKPTGGKVEILVERITEQHQCLAHVKTRKSLQTGAKILLDEHTSFTVLDREDALYHCHSERPVLDILHRLGHMPLPAYMHRPMEASDTHRYQTIYAQEAGSVAAPTAGLHFDVPMMASLSEQGIQTAFLTLHVGAGTFQPVRTDNLLDHLMHKERFTIDDSVVEAIRQTKEKGGRVIPVGTTALRALESAATSDGLKSYQGETQIFIYPGYEFKICDGLVTNFHLPESTLLMLVAAMIGHKQTMDLYQEAIKEKYRFYSYGDCSLLL